MTQILIVKGTSKESSSDLLMTVQLYQQWGWTTVALSLMRYILCSIAYLYLYATSRSINARCNRLQVVIILKHRQLMLSYIGGWHIQQS